MDIKINLKAILKEKNITSKELCEVVGITEANMSILRSGKAKGIRFDTLEKINGKPLILICCKKEELWSFQKFFL